MSQKQIWVKLLLTNDDVSLNSHHSKNTEFLEKWEIIKEFIKKSLEITQKYTLNPILKEYDKK